MPSSQTHKQRIPDVLATLAGHLGRPTDLAPMLDAALALVCDLLDGQRGWVSLLDDPAGRDGDLTVRVPPLDPVDDRALEDELAAGRRRLLSGDLTEPVTLIRLAPSAEAEAVGCLAIVPLRVDGRPLGLLGLAFAGDRRLDDEDLDLLDLAGQTIGLAIDRARRGQARRVADRDAGRQLLAVLEATPDLVATTDVDGRFLQLNRAGRRMLGLGEDEDVTRVSLAEAYPEWAAVRAFLEAIPAALRDGSWSGETTLLSRDGREIPVSQVILAHRDPSGQTEFISTIARDIGERKELEEQLLRLADHDQLTGLFNRRRFQEEVERALAQTRRYGAFGALLFLDLDDFKTVNDSRGHHAGDELLAGVAQVLRERLRETDAAGRLGGDEFAILLPQTDASQAQALAEQVLELLHQPGSALDGQRLGIGASIGIALYPEHGATVRDLLAHADVAMYQAKRDGGRVCLYAPGRREQALLVAQLPWRQRLREALERDLFELYYQPILDLRRGTATQYELLLRLIGEHGEIIRPRAFLHAAERAGLIQEIDHWMVRSAIGLLARHRTDGWGPRLHVNLSGKTFTDGGLLPLVERELATAAVEPDRLVFEIAEATAAADLRQTRLFVEGLRALGCRLALDDFGFGFSSCYHLKRLPVDYLKIDGIFVQNLPRDLADQHLVRAMVEAARGLRARTIAEFVGDEETARLLRACGVDYAQGNHIAPARPLPDRWTKAAGWTAERQVAGA